MTGHRVLDTSPPSAGVRARGHLYVHSAPRALAFHIQTEVSTTWGPETVLDWRPQPLLPGHVRADVAWRGRPGAGARLISTLRAWGHVRAEVVEDASTGSEGQRWSLTPELGVYRATVGPHGDVMVSEDRLRDAMLRTRVEELDLAEELGVLLGEPWDAELEPFRQSSDGSSVRWVHALG